MISVTFYIYTYTYILLFCLHRTLVSPSPHSLPLSFPFFLRASLHHSIHPFLPLPPLPPSLLSPLTPSLPASLLPYLPPSLPASLTPSVPLSLPPPPPALPPYLSVGTYQSPNQHCNIVFVSSSSAWVITFIHSRLQDIL